MIIGVVGFINSGKSTIGDILVENHDFRKMAFADSLKDAVSVIFGWPRRLLEGDTQESREFREGKDEFWSNHLGYDVTPRLILQKFGTEVCRDNIHNDIWISSLEKRLLSCQSNVVITDVRFRNEVQMIHDFGGKIIRVIRGPEPSWYNDAMETNIVGIDKMSEHNIHPSEWDWIGSPIDYYILNHKDIANLKKAVDWYVKNHYNV